MAGQNFSVAHVIRHPDYLPPEIVPPEYGLPHDIALLKVDHDIIMQQYHIAPVCLPQYKYYNTEDEYGVVAGWGVFTGDMSVPTPHLQIGWVRIQKSYQNRFGIWSKDLIIERTPAVNGTMICSVSMV